MFNYLPLQWLFLFFFYSLFGWCFESAYVSVLNKRLVNRGFMRGPFLPLYGAGGIMMLVVSKPYYDNIILVFIAGCIGATALEYVTGVIMETLFKVRYWDYSDKKFNFQGQVCLESTLVWGFFTVVFTHYLQIPIEKILLAIPYTFLSVVTIVLLVINTVDFAMAFRTAMDLRDILVYMEKARTEMQRMQKRLEVLIAFKSEDAKESLENKVEAIGNKVEGLKGTVGSIGSGITARIDTLSGTLEKSFRAAKEKVNRDPAPDMEKTREEVTELYAKYRVLMSRLTPGPVKNLYHWYRIRTISDNPTMSSKMFKNNLEEIKANIVKEREDKKQKR